MAKHKIIVSEPWDFQGVAGDNIIKGRVIKTISSSSVLFESDDLLTFGDYKGKILLLMKRCKGNLSSSFGGGLLLVDDYEDKGLEYLEENSKYVLIGSLKK